MPDARLFVLQFIVGISANASAADIEKAMSHGMDHFVNKPLTLKVVNEIVNLIPKPPEFENLQ
jgi:CheY-like chemotaxis protein